MRFDEKLLSIQAGPLTARGIEILQVNLGYRCNMSCKHCHIQAAPNRNEEMNRETIETVLGILKATGIRILDVTGGAPELNPHFKYLIEKAGEIGCRVIVRTNLTILSDKGMADLPEYFRNFGVELVASLPCYTEATVDDIRGSGTFFKSIETLRMLNSFGYGIDERQKLNLVYNPQGAFLSPPQAALERDYKRELFDRFGISFNHLYTFTNMPVGRFGESLLHTGTFQKYMESLTDAFNSETIDGLMCRRLISVSWDGSLYDCDFNQVLGLKVKGSIPHISDFDFGNLSHREITVGDHCYACTAGQGST